MEDLYQSLAAVLEGQSELVARLIKLGGDETEVLKQNNIEALIANIDSQREPAEELQRLEAERRRLQQAIDERLQLPSGSFKQVLRQAGETAGRLEAAGKLLSEQLRRLQEITETNRLLLGQSLSFGEQMRKALAGMQESYNSKGQKVDAPGLIIDNLNKSV
jgi:seryl-tRNA synthetase